MYENDHMKLHVGHNINTVLKYVSLFMNTNFNFYGIN